VELDGSVVHFDVIVSACGHRPDCTSLPLMKGLLEDSQAQITGGLPHLSDDLQLGVHKKLFVIGSLASLQVGPDAGNLMGIRRAAQILTSAMGFREWLADQSQIDETSLLRNIQGNRYDLLQDDDDDDDDDEESEEEPPKEECDKEWAVMKEQMMQKPKKAPPAGQRKKRRIKKNARKH